MADSWVTRRCLLNSAMDQVESVKFNSPHRSQLISDQILHLLNLSSTNTPHETEVVPKIKISGLCGRGRDRNTIPHLLETLTHLLSLSYASNSRDGEATSPYVLVLEDDVQFPFDLDFTKLVESAPPSFGFLQLVTSESGNINKLYHGYLRNSSNFWIRREDFDDVYSTSADIVNVKVIKPLLEKVLQFKSYAQGPPFFDAKIIGGLNTPCCPRECCSFQMNTFVNNPPCLSVSKGFILHSYLIALFQNVSFVSSIPLAVNGIEGKFSAGMLQDRFSHDHLNGLKLQRRIVNKYLGEEHSLPLFASIACDSKIIDEIIL